ncbi:SprT-like domain-containing protein [Paenibacillus apiarius]|uniref:SprT-like domain-containing protein n=1 Tax=Paenibacillus apiarius TaxID=46240 RepID=UPI003B3AF482
MCRKHWGVDYTGTIELVNREWSSMNGCFIHSREEGIQKIRMSTKVNTRRPREDVIGTLLHELTHWRLWTQKIPHRDINYEFIAECIRVGAPISRARSAQEAYKRYLCIRKFEERADKKFDEEAS